MKYVQFMNELRKRRLEQLGWKFGTVADFLGLSPEEAASIELRIKSLSEAQNELSHKSDSLRKTPKLDRCLNGGDVADEVT